MINRFKILFHEEYRWCTCNDEEGVSIPLKDVESSASKKCPFVLSP